MDLSLGFLFCSIDLYFCLCKQLNLYLDSVLKSRHHFADKGPIWFFQYMHSHSVVSNLCDPMDWIPPDSSVRGILQARILEWVAIQPLAMQGLPSPGDFAYPWIKSRSPVLRTDTFLPELPVVMYGCESWTIKKAECLSERCFQIVVLENTLESPLDCKEIKPVNPKGNQSWIFIAWTGAEAPIFWPPDVKSQLIGKYWCWERLKAIGEGGTRGWDS